MSNALDVVSRLRPGIGFMEKDPISRSEGLPENANLSAPILHGNPCASLRYISLRARATTLISMGPEMGPAKLDASTASGF